MPSRRASTTTRRTDISYKPRSEADLAWAEIERTVRYEYNLAAANAKARALNEVLPELRVQFDDELAATGKLLTLTQARDRLSTLTQEILGELVAGA